MTTPSVNGRNSNDSTIFNLGQISPASGKKSEAEKASQALNDYYNSFHQDKQIPEDKIKEAMKTLGVSRESAIRYIQEHGTRF